ncbi:hypothetical protein AYI70_g539 [Smittium culicis]|uniref:Uncharacterized protein n=1 Tax=Smittium culicis TaxID=133412 RepID=A0A1R1YGC3_9FUNG|nr:hypothetical protein AYI70_g539 [Smittium culicis]
MVIRKPVKRARSLFSDILKGDDPQYATKAELTGTNANSPSVFNQSKLNTQYLNQKTPKKNTKPTKPTKKRAVSLKHLIFGGKQSCLKRFCVAESDQKIGIDWGQFK